MRIEKKNDDKRWKKKIGRKVGKREHQLWQKGERKWDDNDEKKIKIKMSSTAIN